SFHDPSSSGIYTLSLHDALPIWADDALAEFRVATELEPDRLRYAYVYAVALHSAGRTNESIDVLKESFARHPDDRDTLLALVTLDRKSIRLNSSHSQISYAVFCL